MVWAQVEHPNVVPLYGYTEEGENFGSFGALISQVSNSTPVEFQPNSEQWYNNGDAGKFLHEHGVEMTLDERRDLV